MSSRRTAKVAEAIRQVVSTAILFGLRDPRVQNVTVLRVETPVDLRTSKIFVSVFGEEKVQRLTMKGLDAAAGFLQSKIAEELDLRFTPVSDVRSRPGSEEECRDEQAAPQARCRRRRPSGRIARVAADETDGELLIDGDPPESEEPDES